MSHPVCPMCKEVMPLEDKSPKAALAVYPHFPFCSERCKMVDLGHWFDGNYKVSRPIEDETELSD